MTPCSIPAPAQGAVFQGSGWDTGLPEWVPERVDACTHTPLPYAYCSGRVGGHRTREDERSPGVEPCRYGRRVDFERRPPFSLFISDPCYDRCADDWWDVSPGWMRCAS